MSSTESDDEDEPPEVPDANTKELAEALVSIGNGLRWLALALFLGMLVLAKAIHPEIFGS
jgi:hypothetical protein